jgi:hypothetical protein
VTRHTLLRNLWDGRIVSATPAVVVAETADEIVLVIPPGTRRMRADFDALPPPAWDLRELTWRPPAVTVVHRRGRCHSVAVFPAGWDVTVQHRWVEVPTGFDTSDWILRVWFDRDRGWSHRDEDAFEEAVARGLFSPAEAAAVRDEARDVVEHPPVPTAWDELAAELPRDTAAAMPLPPDWHVVPSSSARLRPRATG